MKKSFLAKYYLATPVFLVPAVIGYTTPRVQLPWQGDHYVYIYLAACFALGGFVFRKPLHLHIFAIFECSLNLLLLALSVYLPILSFSSELESGTANGLGVADVFQFCLVAGVLLYGFYSNPLIKAQT